MQDFSHQQYHRLSNSFHFSHFPRQGFKHVSSWVCAHVGLGNGESQPWAYCNGIWETWSDVKYVWRLKSWKGGVWGKKFFGLHFSKGIKEGWGIHVSSDSQVFVSDSLGLTWNFRWREICKDGWGLQPPQVVLGKGSTSVKCPKIPILHIGCLVVYSLHNWHSLQKIAVWGGQFRI